MGRIIRTFRAHRLSYKIDILIALIIMLNILLISSWAYNMLKQIGQNIPAEYDLGIIDRYGYTGIRVTYDTEPVDVELISPSGKRYDKNTCNSYEINETDKTITAMVDTTEIGLWRARLNQKTNRNIKYAFLTKASSIIHMDGGEIIEINGDPYVTFVPVMETSNGNTCEYSMWIKNRNKAFPLSSGDVALNKKAYIMIDPPKSAFTGDNYILILTLTSKTEKPTHVSKEFTIFLAEYTEPDAGKETVSKNGQ